MNIPDLTDNELNIDPDVEAIFQEMTGIRFEAD